MVSLFHLVAALLVVGTPAARRRLDTAELHTGASGPLLLGEQGRSKSVKQGSSRSSKVAAKPKPSEEATGTVLQSNPPEKLHIDKSNSPVLIWEAPVGDAPKGGNVDMSSPVSQRSWKKGDTAPLEELLGQAVAKSDAVAIIVFDLSGPILDVADPEYRMPQGRGRIFAFWERKQDIAKEDLVQVENKNISGWLRVQKKQIGDGLARVVAPQIAVDKGVHTFVAVAMDDAEHAYALFRDRDVQESRDFVAETMYPAVMQGAPAPVAAIQLERPQLPINTIVSHADYVKPIQLKGSPPPSVAGEEHQRWAPVVVWDQDDEDEPWTAACTYDVLPSAGRISFKLTSGDCEEESSEPLHSDVSKNMTGLSQQQHLHEKSSAHQHAVVSMLAMLMPLSVAFALV